jgi:hypothetical protein
MAALPSRRDHIPLLARNTVKAAVDWEARSWLSFHLDMTAQSGVFARGNENNAHSRTAPIIWEQARPRLLRS